MGKKVIKCILSTDSIQKAIDQLREYERDIKRKTERLRERIANRLAADIDRGFDTATVDDIIRGGSPRTADVRVIIESHNPVTLVIARGEDAVWVEFGAGVFYNAPAGASPHPKGDSLNFKIGEYGKGHGKQRAWGYYSDGELIITRGTPAKMPMARAVGAVAEDIASIAREVFG